MLELLRTVVRSALSALRPRRDFALENLALRHQLAVLRRGSKRPQLNKIQAELKKAADATGRANDKQFAMNAELNEMTGAINGQFPGPSGAISVR